LDSGPDSSVLHELPKVMPSFSRSLDMIIESHPDSDHMAGFVDVLGRYRAGAYLTPGIIKDSTSAYALEKEVQSEGVPRYIARRGEVIDLGGGAVLQILAPDHDVTDSARTDDNEGSIVARLVYGGTSVMLTGDMPKDLEQHLIDLEHSDHVDELGSVILKVGHHGSRNSTSAQFVSAVRPSLAVISVGPHNRYGHPSKETLDTLAAAGVPTERTDQDGTLIFKSDGAHFWQVR
ncbi:MAG TPA: MBL fold metallo-hydrolase, partial [Candidatus Paceibacterota bacterium]